MLGMDQYLAEQILLREAIHNYGQSLFRENQNESATINKTEINDETVLNENTKRYGSAIVLDTNTYILQSDIVRQTMKNRKLTVIVPISVTQELDRLKSSSDHHCSNMARKWNKFMNEQSAVLAKGEECEWNIRFQNSEEYERAESLYEAKKADDRIISCAQYFSENKHLVPRNTLTRKNNKNNNCDLAKSTPKRVVLITNDNNMATMARSRMVNVTMLDDLVRKMNSPNHR